MQAEAVTLAGRVAGSGECERREGLPLDLLLAAEARLTGGDRHTLITAGQVLETMPHLAQAHRDGRVSWGQVRHAVRAVRRRGLEDRAVLDGPVHGGFEYDAVSAATVLNALAAQQGGPEADELDRCPEFPTPQQRSSAQALVDICVAYLAGGGSGRRARPAFIVDVDLDQLDAAQPGRLRLRLPGAPRRLTARWVAEDAAAAADVRVVITDGAAPLAVSGVVRTDARDLDRDEAGAHARLLRVPRPAQPGVAALLAAVNRALASPDLAAIADGRRPLTDPRLLDADDIPTATRIAVAARDRGCRFYGCDAPVDWCDVHHIEERAHGGDHHPDRLVLLCRPHHRGMRHRPAFLT